VSDYFESIGFTLERPEFETQLQRALAEGEHLVAEHGDYHVWHIGEAELWVTMYRLGKRRELAGANPHFEGGARMAVIVESLDRNAEFPLEGELYAWAATPGDDGDVDAKEHGIYPFSASLPDYDIVAANARRRFGQRWPWPASPVRSSSGRMRRLLPRNSAARKRVSRLPVTRSCRPDCSARTSGGRVRMRSSPDA